MARSSPGWSWRRRAWRCDPLCRSFDIGSPKIADAYRVAQWSDGHAYNCGIQHHEKTDPAVQSARSTRAPVGSDTAREANCWTNYEMEGTCTTQPEWAPDKAAKCFDPSAALGGGVAGRSSIGGIADWFDDGGMQDPVGDASYLARVYAIDADTCDGWTVDGAPDVQVSTPSSDDPTTIIIVVVAAVVCLLLLAALAFVVAKKKKKPIAHPATGAA